MLLTHEKRADCVDDGFVNVTVVTISLCIHMRAYTHTPHTHSNTVLRILYIVEIQSCLSDPKVRCRLEELWVKLPELRENSSYLRGLTGGRARLDHRSPGLIVFLVCA